MVAWWWLWQGGDSTVTRCDEYDNITPRSSPSYSSRLSGEVAARNCSCLPSRAYPDMNICTQLGLVVQDISSFELYSTATFLPRLKETARYLSQSLLSNTHAFFSEQNLRRRIIELSKVSCQWTEIINHFTWMSNM